MSQINLQALKISLGSTEYPTLYNRMIDAIQDHINSAIARLTSLVNNFEQDSAEHARNARTSEIRAQNSATLATRLAQSFNARLDPGAKVSLNPRYGHSPYGLPDGHIGANWIGDVPASEGYFNDGGSPREIIHQIVEDDADPEWIYKATDQDYFEEENKPGGAYLGSFATGPGDNDLPGSAAARNGAADIYGHVVEYPTTQAYPDESWYHLEGTNRFYSLGDFNSSTNNTHRGEIFRAGANHFPERSVAVVYADRVVIYDTTTGELQMWMVLKFGGALGASYPESTFNAITSDNLQCAAYCQGILAIGMYNPTGGTTGGVLVIDFIRNRIDLFEGATYGHLRYHGTIGQRHDGLGFGELHGAHSLNDNMVQSVGLALQANGDMLLYAGTHGGLSRIANIINDPSVTEWVDPGNYDFIHRLTIAGQNSVLALARLDSTHRVIVDWGLDDELTNVNHSVKQVGFASAAGAFSPDGYQDHIQDFDADNRHVFVGTRRGAAEKVYHKHQLRSSLIRNRTRYMATGYLSQADGSVWRKPHAIGCNGDASTLTDTDLFDNLPQRIDTAAWTSAGNGVFVSVGGMDGRVQNNVSLPIGTYLFRLTYSNLTVADSFHVRLLLNDGTIILLESISSTTGTFITTIPASTPETTLDLYYTPNQGARPVMETGGIPTPNHITAIYIGCTYLINAGVRVNLTCQRVIGDELGNNGYYKSIGSISRPLSAGGDIRGFSGFSTSDYLESVNIRHDMDLSDTIATIVYKDEGVTGISTLFSNYNGVEGTTAAGIELIAIASSKSLMLRMVDDVDDRVDTLSFGKVNGDGIYHSVLIMSIGFNTVIVYFDGEEAGRLSLTPKDGINPMKIGIRDNGNGTLVDPAECEIYCFAFSAYVISLNLPFVAQDMHNSWINIVTGRAFFTGSAFMMHVNHDPYTHLVAYTQARVTGSISTYPIVVDYISAETGEVVKSDTLSELTGTFGPISDTVYHDGELIVGGTNQIFRKSDVRPLHHLRGADIPPTMVVVTASAYDARNYHLDGYSLESKVLQVYQGGELEFEGSNEDYVLTHDGETIIIRFAVQPTLTVHALVQVV